jgi:hypothetical protein
MKKLIFMGLGIFLGLFSIWIADLSITIQSWESKTNEGLPVFNQIRFLPGWSKDIWLMKQSHMGSEVSKDEWDRLAIVVDKKTSQATFYQLPPSKELEFEPKPIAFKARCFACHSNGPRAIRPNYRFGNSLLERVKVGMWNLRIKMYGHLQSQGAAEFVGGVPIQSRHALLGKPLNLKSCQGCHNNQGLRNELKLEQIGTMRFLVENGQMPPFPFQISEEDRRLLDKINF